MIGRIWHGWTAVEDAEAYQTLLENEIIPGIERRLATGLLGLHLLRRTVGEEVEFVTIMWFESLASVRAFSGEDYEAAVVPPRARALLARFDERSRHYDVTVDTRARARGGTA